MLYLSIVFTLFALMAGMLLLSKTRKDQLGKFFSMISYLIIIVSLLLLICQCTRGIMRMTCHSGNCASTEHCSYMSGMDGKCEHGSCMMMHHGCTDGNVRCMEEMKECKMKGDSASCKMGMKHGCPMEGQDDAKADSGKK